MYINSIYACKLMASYGLIINGSQGTLAIQITLEIQQV